jgi:ribosomal protein S18 acetylase RimI-like enzyme
LKDAGQGNIRIVTLLVSDWREYKELRLRALQREPQAFCSSFAREAAWPDEKWRQRLRDATDGETWMFFARLDGKLVGMIGGGRSDDDMQSHRCHVWGMYVAEEARRKGVAKALVLRLLHRMRGNENVNAVRLEVNVNQELARRLYESLGFSVVGREMVVFGDGSENEVLVMEKALRDIV